MTVEQVEVCVANWSDAPTRKYKQSKYSSGLRSDF